MRTPQADAVVASRRACCLLAAAFAAFFLFAPAAPAQRGVIGTLNGVGGGPAVNANGAGGASPGDIYGGTRHFSADGTLLQEWGIDKVSAGPDNSNEVQQVMIEATGGTFTLTFDGQATAPIAATAGAAAVKAALEALPNVTDGALGVAGGPGDAAGSSPYLITYEGAMGGVDQPMVVVDPSSLTGGPATGWSAQIVDGGTGFEICRPASGDTCKSPTFGFGLATFLNGGVDSSFAGIAVDQETGAVYGSGSLARVNKYSATGQFQRSFGFDVVASGPDDSHVDAVKALRVKATGGTYTLTFGSPCCNQETTAPIPYNAPAAAVQSALNAALNQSTSSAGFGGKVSITGGPGDASGSAPYEITFGGKLGGDAVWGLSSSVSGLAGAGKEAAVTDLRIGGGQEVCVHPVDSCDRGRVSTAFEDFSTYGIDTDATVSVAPSGAPNAGHVLLAEPSFGEAGGRVSEYTGDGEFVRKFGGGVVDGGAEGTGTLTSGSRTISSVLTTAKQFSYGQTISGTGILPGTTITRLGPEALTLSQPATASGAGIAITVPEGSANVPSNERQRITVKPTVTGGNFQLTFSTPNPSASTATTANIPFNATVAQVQAALEGLTNLGAGNVEATLDPGGNAGGGIAPGGPWTVEFRGKYADTDVKALVPSSGSPELEGGSARIATTTIGAGSFEVCTAISGDYCQLGKRGTADGQFAGLTAVAEDTAGNIYTVEAITGGEGNRRVQKFTDTGGLTLTASSAFGANEVQRLTVTASGGQFRLTAIDPKGTTGTANFDSNSAVLTNVTTTNGAFAVGQPIVVASDPDLPYFATIVAVGPSTITLSRSISSSCNSGCPIYSTRPYSTPDLPFNASAAQVESALNALPPIAETGGTVSVSGGPGDATGSSPYSIVFDGGPLARTDFSPLRGSQGTTPLAGGSGPEADQAGVITVSDGGPRGRSNVDSPLGIDVGPAGEVLIAKRFPNGAADCGDPSRSAAADGSISSAEVRIQEFTPDGTTVVETSKPCSVDRALFPAGEGTVGGDSSVFTGGDQNNLKVDPITGLAYLTGGYVFGQPGGAPSIALNPPADISSAAVRISGEINPNGPALGAYPNPVSTLYRVEFKKASESTWVPFGPDAPLGAGTAPLPFSLGISGLQPGTPYEARVVALKQFGPAVVGPVQPFMTLAARPRIDGFSSSEVTADSANLHARISPLGTPTTYHFEYGTTIDYGQSTPETPIGGGLSVVTVLDHLEGLEPAVYHFRVVATNSVGTTTTSDQTFTFYPEPCPNSAARQQTGASALPDCRAYELVSPGRMGTITLFTQGPTSPLASNPPRFSYAGILGTLPGPWNPPNLVDDRYVATRTSTGWETRYVGIQADEFGLPGITPPGATTTSGSPGENGVHLSSDLSLDRFLAWGGDAKREPRDPYDLHVSSAPYLYNAHGDFLGRLPTNLSEFPGGDLAAQDGGFVGDQLLSPDASHYLYSSADVALAPGGLTSGAGSVYDNDLAAKTVSIASKTAAGTDIPAAPGPFNAGHFLQVPAVSRDGSHILIAAPAACPGSASREVACPASPAVLYMRVDGDVSYDVSEGHPVKFEAMSADGSAVYFTTADQMAGTGDTDTGIDLYRWSEATAELTRVSDGPGAIGNSDGCLATWVSKCGVQVVPKAVPSANTSGLEEFVKIRTDNSIAATTGDIYFYSPEQLAGPDGVPGRRNLYLLRNGSLQYVATLDSDKPIRRIQVSPDGRYAAFLTASSLTTYDNESADGICSKDAFGNPQPGPFCLEMYHYDAATRDLLCVSCIPGGAAPSSDVTASQNGIFMADDGRTFFSTSDALVPADTDGLADVYEYVDGRAQLITTGAAKAVKANSVTGLVGVSANGTDVYFSTLETLVAADENGPFLKFYDARSGGGFPVNAPIQPCAAADECHGASQEAPPAQAIASGADLGARGNVSTGKKHSKKKHRHRKHKKHRKHRSHSNTGGAK